MVLPSLHLGVAQGELSGLLGMLCVCGTPGRAACGDTIPLQELYLDLPARAAGCF